jgi:HK97 family phage portal protein
MAWSFTKWFRGGGALSEGKGDQYASPSTPNVDGLKSVSDDNALQISTVWACVERRANLVASLPLFVYEREENGQKTLARDTQLYRLLHDSPNSRMTSFEFWRAMVMNHDIHGNAYARIDRNSRGEAIALWPMPSTQVTPVVLDDGAMVYKYDLNGNVAVLAEQNVLHIKNLGNGTVGLSKLEFMRPTLDETIKAQDTASKIFGSTGKPSGLLMIDAVLSKEQRKSIQESFQGMQLAGAGKLTVLEAGMKYQQLTMTPEDMQLIDSRKYSVEEVCRWMDMPPVLVYHSNVTTWGSGIEQVIDGFYKLSARPLLTSIEQAVSKRVLTSSQRVSFHVEFSLDAILRGSLKDRMDSYKTAVNYGLKTINECRQLENDPPIDGGDKLMIQSNMVTLEGAQNAGQKTPIA